MTNTKVWFEVFDIELSKKLHASHYKVVFTSRKPKIAEKILSDLEL